MAINVKIVKISDARVAQNEGHTVVRGRDSFFFAHYLVHWRPEGGQLDDDKQYAVVMPTDGSGDTRIVVHRSVKK